MTLNVLPSALDEASGVTSEAADHASGVKADEFAEAVTAAMPGSKSAGAGGQLGSALNKRAQAWSQSFTTHAENLTGAANLYRTNEQAAEEAFTDPTGSTTGHMGVE